jgi:3-hydroxybutyryl-CoA dehydratase
VRPVKSRSVSVVLGDFASFRTVEIGDVLSGRVTVTESHIVMAAGVFGDFSPVHMDDLYASGTRYGRRIAHVNLVAGIMAGVLSKALGTNAIGYLEQNVRFEAPVFPSDTVSTEWTVTEKLEKPTLRGGIVRVDGTCSSDNAGIVMTAQVALLVAYGDG